jgi:hypothetical protein
MFTYLQENCQKRKGKHAWRCLEKCPYQNTFTVIRNTATVSKRIKLELFPDLKDAGTKGDIGKDGTREDGTGFSLIREMKKKKYFWNSKLETGIFTFESIRFSYVVLRVGQNISCIMKPR